MEEEEIRIKQGKNKDIAINCKSFCISKGDKGVVIVDLDGTLACGKHRLHLLPKSDLHLTESWVEFNSACVHDDAISDTIGVVDNLQASNIIIILTGRSDHAESETIHWLADNNVKYDYLVMRSRFDNRKDTTIKEEFIMQVGIENILCAFDDSPNVIGHLRGMGITTYAVTSYQD